MANWHDHHCPHPEKAAFKRRQKAEGAATRMYRLHGQVARPYRCICTWWHLTTHTASGERIPAPNPNK